MSIIPFRDWRPDEADLGNRASIVVANAVPGKISYKPFPSFDSLTNALTNTPLEAIWVRDKDNNTYQYAADSGKLYELVGQTWTDRSKGGGYSTGADETWDMVKWKNQLLATNYTDNMQAITLGGLNFADLTTSHRARWLAVVGDYLVTASTFDSTDGDVRDRVRWSAFDDATDFTVSPTTGSDFRDLKGSPIQRVLGGEYGVIFSLTSTYRMDFVGTPSFFQINETLPGVGLLAPKAVARIGDLFYIWSNQGFLAIRAGTGFEPIGAGRVDDFAFTDLDDSYLQNISAVSDPTSGRVFWLYPGAGNTSGAPNKIICYDKNFDKWSLIEQEAAILYRAGGTAFTVEQLDTISSDLDSLPASFDSSLYKGGGQVLLAAFDSSKQSGYFQGTPMTARIESKEVEIHPGRRTMLKSFRPLVDGGSFTARVGYRDKQTGEPEYTPVLNPTTTGRVTRRVNAKYHRMEVTVSGEWEDAIGVQVEQDDARVLGVRG